MRQFRDRVMLAQPSGRRYVELLESHTVEIIHLMAADANLRKRAIDVLQKLNDVVVPARGESGKISAALLKAVGDLLKAAGGKASPELKKTLATLQTELKFFEGQTAESGLKMANGKLAG